MRLLILAALGLAACSDYNFSGQDKSSQGQEEEEPGTGSDSGVSTPDSACADETWPAEEVGVDDVCPSEPEGGFTPIVEWDYGAGRGCLSLPVVADLDADGMPEVIMNLTTLLNAPGTLVVLRGDGSGVVWDDDTAALAYGSPPAVADLDGDGSPEIVGVRENSSAMFGEGDYTALAWDAAGNQLWETEHFIGLDFDWASAPVISDMDHDGSPEIVIGRVILNADGTTRGIGGHGHGSYGIFDMFGITISEGSVPVVTDLDLDGVEEVIVGNAAYDADGNTLWSDSSLDDAMIGVANLDDDPEGEIVAISYNTVRAMDTDGSVMWGPITIPSANILATPAIADLDDDGYPEIVTAGGNRLVTFNHDGTELWTAPVTDESGATGASVFDFEGDGIPEVVYIDEVEMVAYDGPTGAVKFYSTDHASNTMFDYPVIADVDADDHAEILVCHNGHSSALSVYGDQDDTWAPARKLWNQHAYGISNINDDLSVPVTATPNFADTNTWHSAIPTDGEALAADLAGEIMDVCTDDCDEGVVKVALRVNNIAHEEQAAGVRIALYARIAEVDVLVATAETDDAIASGWSSEGITLEVAAEDLAGADALWAVVDDDGTGTGLVQECSESNNGYLFTGPFCE